MRNHRLLAVILMFVTPVLYAQSDHEPDLKGYVTQVSSPTVFDVNGIHVRVDDNTRIHATANTYISFATADIKLYIGQPVQVYGNRQKKEHAISATQIDLPQFKPFDVAGHAIIDAVLDAPAPGEHLLRADGRRILISANTAKSFEFPLAEAAGFHTNVWITFHGLQRADGVVVADKASFVANAVNHSEDKLRNKSEYDPESIPTNANQSQVSKMFAGVDPRQIPPYKDDAMQARIDRIGASLVPQYQRELPPDDETKIEFRFQLVDEKCLITPAQPSGIILVSYQAVQRMQSDSQLAALIAWDMAIVLEKDTFRVRPAMHKLRAANMLGAVGGAFVPGLGLASYLATGIPAQIMLQHLWEQSVRVSLCLMHDAGYDIQEAPRAWWLLADKKSKGMEGTPIPQTSEYVYKVLGETWRPQ